MNAGGAASTDAAAVTLTRCLACGGARLRPLALAYAWRGERYPLAECRSCRMRFLSRRPRDPAARYDAAYFESDFRCGRSAATSFDEAAFRGETAGLLDAFASLGPPGRLLEVGCASGWLLKHGRERGWQVQGVEIAAEAVAHARGLGLEVFHGDLLQAALPASSFDLVYMGDVLEHVPDCRAVLEETARVLAPGGWLYLRGPTTTHSLARSLALAAFGALGRTIVLEEPPYHLWEFTPGALAGLMRTVGLEVARVRQSKIPPGHARGRKSGLERAAMAALDALNVPLTAALNVCGDRVVMIARRPPVVPRTLPAPVPAAAVPA
jgi:SAM-dependent methyltransferase